MKHKMIKAGLAFWMAASAIGCSNAAPQAKDGAAPSGQAPRIDDLGTKEPITLTIWSGVDATTWNDTVVEPLSKKFPNVKVEQYVGQKQSLRDLLAAGSPPDIVMGSKNHMIFEVLPAGLQYDMTPLVEKYKYDLGRFRPELAQSVKSFDDSGKLYALPFQNVIYGLMYNKRIFERFGVPMPKDGMTWEEAIRLAAQVTRLDNGVQYRGLDIQFYNIIASQRSLPVIDKNGKAQLSAWSEPAAVFKQMYDVPGNNREIKWGVAYTFEPFFTETLAMLGASLGTMLGNAKNYPNLDWDLVTMPTMPGAPKTDPYLNYTFLSVTPTSKYKEEAFKVIAYLLSDQVQTDLMRKGYVTTLKDEAIQKQFAADVPALKSKHFQSAFAYKQTDPYVSVYQTSQVDTQVRNAFDKIRRGESDINTILRQADDAIDKMIAQEKAK